MRASTAANDRGLGPSPCRPRLDPGPPTVGRARARALAPGEAHGRAPISARFSHLPPALLILALGVPLAAAATEPDCKPTPASFELSSVAPAAGSEPFWMVSERCWVESPSKTVWIVDRRYGGDLQVQGWSASDRTPVTFHAADGSRTSELVVRNAGRTSVVPGGTSSDERARYAFHTGGVAYPRPGCWLLTAEYGGRTVEVVVEKVRCDEAGRPLHGED